MRLADHDNRHPQHNWQITDTPFHAAKLPHTETIFTVGNGYMGIRGTFDEGHADALVSTLVHGIFNQAEGQLVPELVNLPNPLSIHIEIDGEPFSLSSGRIVGYEYTLDLHHALLTRGVLWKCPNGNVVRLLFERFASLELEHLLVQRVTIQPLNRDCRVVVTASIDGTHATGDTNHWRELRAAHHGNCRMSLSGLTSEQKYRVAVASSLTTPNAEFEIAANNDFRPTLRTEFDLVVGQSAVIHKYSAIHTTRDASSPLAAAALTLDTADSRGWDSLFAGHVAEWTKYWQDCDIQIEGDDMAQRALRLSIYHVLIAAPRHDEHVSIGAKTLSGPGYKGHVFWDTDTFIVPFLTVTQPKLARNLLMYRYHNLQGARNKAKEAGYEGTMFPWESTDTGEETTPRWITLVDQPIRVWSGDHEQHISTDIAHSVLDYWRWTGDVAFMVNHGAEIVLDTAVFWGSRVEYIAEQDRYELHDQIGPDEYHENINNSAFVNSIVRWHLREAIRLLDWLRAEHPQQATDLAARLTIDETRLAHWQTVIDKMYIPYNLERGILEEYDGFFNLKPINLDDWQPRIYSVETILGHEAVHDLMVIKQADIVMLMALLGEEFGSHDYQLRHWNYYAPKSDHGSSLSAGTHARVAARLNVPEAYDIFKIAAGIDLEDSKGNVRDGIHAAACGGLWQAAVFGFAGLHIDGQRFSSDPHLPARWKSMTFSIYFRGQSYRVSVKV